MKKRILSIVLSIVMLVSLLPTTAWATNIEGTISSDVTWNDGDVISDAVTLSGGTETMPMVVTVNGTVTVNAELIVTGHVRITGGGTLVRGSNYTTGNMLEVNGSLTLENITVDGNNVSLSDRRGVLVYNSLTINEGAVLKNHHRRSDDYSMNYGSVLCVLGGNVTMNGGRIENNTGRNYGNIYLDAGASFFMNGGTVCNNTLTYDGTYGGGAFYVRNASLTVNGGTISGHTDIPSKGGAIYCTSNGKVYLNGGAITDNSSKNDGDAIFYSSEDGSAAELHIGGNPLITNNIYLDNRNSNKYPYITSPIKNSLILEVREYEENRVIAVGSNYTLTEADMAKVTLKTTNGTVCYAKLDTENNRLLMTDTDPNYTEKFYVTYLGNGGTGSTLDNTTYELNSNATALDNGFQREGYDFVGWNTKADGSGTSYTPGASIPMTGDVILYAIWKVEKAASVSITETDQTYTWDGNPKSFAITGTPNTGFTVQYKVNGNWTTTAPSAVGTYDVKITRAEDDTYKAYEKIITGGLVINAATPTATEPTAKTGLVYDGNAKSLINAGTSEHGYWEYSLNGTSYSSDIPTGTDAKTYTVYCRFVPNTGNANIDPVELSVTIDPMAVDEPTVNDSYIYTGSEQTVTLNGFNDSYMTIAGNKGTNAGCYEVVITLDSNHAWKSGSDGRVQWSIGKAEPTVTWPTGTAYVNDTSVTLTGGSAAGVGTETFVEGSFTLEAVDLTSAGTKTVKITFAPNSTNYKNVEKTDYSVTVSKRTVESVAEQTAVENAVYGTEQDALGLPASVEITVSGNKKFTAPVTWSGYDKFDLNEQTLTGVLDLSVIAGEVENSNSITASIVVDLQEKNAAAFSFKNKTETYSGSPISHEIGGELEGVASISYSYESSEYAASSTAPTNAGVYEVTATFTMQPGYAAVAPKTATLTISPKEAGLDWSELTAAELVYSGTAKTLTATATGLADGDSCTVTVELVGDNINVGTFSYEATALSNQNYKLPVDVSSPEYTITPKTLTITADSYEVYVGSRQPELTYTVDGLVGTDTLTTAPTLSTDANMYRAGTYAITFASEAAAGNNYSITYVNGTLTVKNSHYIPQPTYDVEIADDITGGEVSASKKLAYSGDTITITVVPDAGYELTKLTVTDSRDNAVSVTKVTDIKYTFKMPGYDVEIDAVFAKIDTTCPCDWTCPMYGYTDLDRTLWYHDGIHYCIEHGLMVGTGTNIFEPNIATSRAMIVTILWRLEGSPIVNYAMDFEDVAADQWYTEAIRWAASEKIVEGYGNGQFGTNDAITREQMVTIMFRYAKYKSYDVSVGENTNILSYDDAFDVAEWAIPAMQWACGSGMIQGIADGNQMNLVPQGNATRAQAAAILQRYCENVANKD